MATAARRYGGRTLRPRSFAAAALVGMTLLAGCGAQDSGTADTTDEVGAQMVETEDVADAAAELERTHSSTDPLVTAEPDEYSRVGDLVAGFPIELLPVPGDAVILVTSAAPVGDADVREVSLNLRTSATARELLDLYRDALTEAGFSEVTGETSDSDLAVEVTFVRSGGDELVSIGVLDVDGARTVTIGGRVRTEE